MSQILFPWFLQMDATSPCYASRWSPNISSPTWIIYSPSHEFIHIDSMCVGVSINSQDESNDFPSLLTASLHLGICHLDLFIDSHLFVSQLNNCYRVRARCIFRNFLRTRHLVRHFKSISFMHFFRNFLHTRHLVRHFKSISFMHFARSLNSVKYQMTNGILEPLINH